MYWEFITKCSYIKCTAVIFFISPLLYSWFAVHCTSMNNSNHLISGDNKGYASMLMEQYKDPGSLPGKVSAWSEAWSDGIACNVNKNKININKYIIILLNTMIR